MENSNHAYSSRPVKHWYLPLILGVVFIAVGIWVIFTPLSSYLALSLLFAVTFLFSGSLGVWYAITNREILSGWGWSLAAGIAELFIGILLIARFDLTVVILALYVGFAMLFRSIMAMIWSFELKKLKTSGWGGMLVLGILGAFLAFILLWNPLLAGLTVVFYTALAFITIGGLQVYLSLKLRKLNK